MSITEDLLTIVDRVATRIDIPAVTQVVLPDVMLSLSEANAKYDKFGLLCLKTTGPPACGFFYRLLCIDEVLQERQQRELRQLADSAVGKNSVEIAAWLNCENNFSRAIGLAAVNAITQYVYQMANFSPPIKVAIESQKKSAVDKNPTSENRGGADGRVGLVGYFGKQIDALLKSGREVFVLELDQSLYRQSGRLVVSGDRDQLETCHTIYCTASTLINQTLDGLLEDTSSKHFELIGPSAGCFPDPLFDRGVDFIGGSRVLDTDLLAVRVANGLPWQSSVAKYQLDAKDYPGIEVLLDSI